MKTSLVVTFTGVDRPGIVESLSRVVTANGGNWERSRMARLAGRFAGILEVTADADRAPVLAAELQRVQGLTVLVDRNGLEAEPLGDRSLTLELTGQDREGIVREVAAALAQRHVNIEDLETESVSAPMSGEMLFKATAHLRCPPGLDLVELRKAMEAVSGDLLVDIALTERKG